VRTIVDAGELDADRADRAGPAATSRERGPEPDPDRIVQIALTSGTTGPPKLASLSARLKQLTFQGFTSRLGIGPGDRVLPLSPITQGVGEMCLYALRTGATMVMAHDPRFDPERALALIERSGATVLCGVPTMIGRLLHCPALANTDLSALRATISAGSALAPGVAQEWERHSDSSTCSFYGAMDIGQLAVPRPQDPPQKRWTTVGRPHERAELLICDPAGVALPAGATGEICMRGPLVQQRYWGESEGPFAPDGWAHFGDLGFVDADGYVHVTGRLKDTIIRGGNNINPVEVEELLRRCPGVMDACVVGRPDPDLGERAVAFVVATADGSPELGAVAGFLEAQGLTRCKWPEFMVLVDALPIGSTGKIDRGALRIRAAREARS
jgi:acyl-CoA synthetase (AMP-forming)/AMP-acid ligase II